MILTRKQEEGLKIAVERYKAHEKYTVISGYAGTGKSTLIKFIIAALNLNPEDVCYIAFTGKAVQVLKQKGCPNAMTAHKLLYKAKTLPNGKYKFEPLSYIGDYKVIVVDEISMLPSVMWERLLMQDVYVIACGDPFQLPPIDSYYDNHVLEKPHIFLDEIMRQAYDNEIIRFSMWIREGKPINMFPVANEQVMFIRYNDINTGLYEWADQIICATNKQRQDINTTVRQIKGFGPYPQIGDKIISLHNQWDFLSDGFDMNPITNGSIGIIEKMNQKYIQLPYWMKSPNMPILYTTMTDESGNHFSDIPIDYTALTTGNKFLTPQQESFFRKMDKLPDPPFEFTYAYAITGHKGQGSEWNKVLAMEERFPNEREEHARWCYTVATRASEKLVWTQVKN